MCGPHREGAHGRQCRRGQHSPVVGRVKRTSHRDVANKPGSRLEPLTQTRMRRAQAPQASCECVLMLCRVSLQRAVECSHRVLQDGNGLAWLLVL